MKNVTGGFPKRYEGQSDEEALKEYLKPVVEEIDDKYMYIVKRLQRSSIDSDFVSIKLPTEEKPWVTIKMSNLTYCEAVPSMEPKDKKYLYEEIPYIVTATDGDGNPVDISAELVKELRSRTKRGMMECKKALVLSLGNIDEAVLYLKKHI